MTCGWCSGPEGAKIAHCYGKKWSKCQCTCTQKKKPKKKVETVDVTL